MVEHVWSVLCNHTIIDRDTNSISLLLAVTEIRILGKNAKELAAEVEAASGQYAVNVKLSLTGFWVRSDFSVPEKATAAFRILAPSGKEIVSAQETPINLTEATGFRSRIAIDGFPIYEGLGLYWIEIGIVEAGGLKRVARLPVTVTLDQPKKKLALPAPKPAPARKPKRAHRAGKKR